MGITHGESQMKTLLSLLALKVCVICQIATKHKRLKEKTIFIPREDNKGSYDSLLANWLSLS